ncbi:SusC/RagA family TonB-linked outer membrane protein [Galbibacter pacificus]|uniref:TonB-dependent receptor n=1 Tax=Galbibacter pacificus TaxID=2996052 RepID=A0ABT6FN52_9FLAO|nr:TonB-dependent receptor [Galbibacter pacificus]MDG3581208.1 TonB-dependent receptor [Galbibacter pacificus]MDG3584686.1 TonB-dependent receptor [Galbibacter pacificus]
MKRSTKKFSLTTLFLLIFVLGQSIQAQEKSVTGNVTDNQGIPIAGANIMIKGTSNGTTTDFDGNFTISIGSSTVTLIVSYIGFASTEVKVSPNQNINVALKEDVSQLDEVVVIGYGTQERKDLTGSVATISSKDIEDIPVSSLDQKLAGQVPGVQVSTVTGTPGGASKINIRGVGSIGANSDPLVVIDGFPISNSFNQTSNPLNLVNPDDIESISILKDASSTAIYGSRGANGVLIIKTKQGKTGKLQVDLNTYTGFQTVPEKGRPDMLNAQEFAQFQKEIREDAAIAAGGTVADAVIPEMYQNPEQYGEGTDWFDTILQTALQQNVNLNVRGGSESLRGSMSLGYFNQEGVVRYTGYERYTMRTNFNADIGKKVKVGLSLAPTFSKQDINDLERDFLDIIGKTQWFNPIIPVTDENGNRTPHIGGPGLFSAPNPLNELEYAGTEVEEFRGIASAFAEFEIFNGFTAKYTFTVDYNNGKRSRFYPSFLGNTNSPPPNVPTLSVSEGDILNQSSEFLLNYKKDFNEKHSLGITAGYSNQKETAESISVNGTDFPDDEIETLGAAGRISSYGQGVEEWALISYFARVNYDFLNRYLLTATIRSDGSSRFGSENRYGTFPSIGAAWRISEESFMENSFFDNLKLRTSYGLSGNFNIGNYTYISTVGTSNYVFGNSIASGRYLNSLGNPNLTWEESRQLDIGLEASFLNNRLDLTLDYYRRNTENMLIDTQIPFSSGFGSATINGGEILNQGLEVAINSRNFTGDFSWTTNFNIAFNKNKVLALDGDSNFILSGRSGEGNPTHITQVGKPIGQFYGYVIEGVYMNEEDFDNSPKHSSSVVGSIKYKDVNGDGVIEAVNDFDVIGNPYPDFTFGLTNSFSYKNFDLSIVIDGQYGGELLVGANQFLDNIDGIFNVTTDVFNRWRSPENPGDGKTPTTNGARVIYRDVNSSWVEDSSFLRFRNITFGYNLPSEIFGENSFIKRLRIYTTVNNALMFSAYERANPQAASPLNRGGGSVALVPGMDFTSYPLAKTFILGLNFSF